MPRATRAARRRARARPRSAGSRRRSSRAAARAAPARRSSRAKRCRHSAATGTTSGCRPSPRRGTAGIRTGRAARLTAAATGTSVARGAAGRPCPAKMIALSWSVASVCSPRPSLPRAIQQRRPRSSAAPAPVSSISRPVTRSFSGGDEAGDGVRPTALVEEASGQHPDARRRGNRRVDIRAPLRIAALTSSIPPRQSENSRDSETTPTSRPSSTSGTCRMSSRAISSAASKPALRRQRPDLARHGVADGSAEVRAAGARRVSSTSCSVNTPSGRRSASTTIIDPIRVRRIVSSTVRSGVSGAQLTGRASQSPGSGPATGAPRPIPRACARGPPPVLARCSMLGQVSSGNLCLDSGGLDRKGEREASALPRRTLHPHPAAEMLDDLPADVQSEPGALRLPGERVACLAEFVEDQLLVLALMPGPLSRTSTRTTPSASASDNSTRPCRPRRTSAHSTAG